MPHHIHHAPWLSCSNGSSVSLIIRLRPPLLCAKRYSFRSVGLSSHQSSMSSAHSLCGLALVFFPSIILHSDCVHLFANDVQAYVHGHPSFQQPLPSKLMIFLANFTTSLSYVPSLYLLSSVRGMGSFLIALLPSYIESPSSLVAPISIWDVLGLYESLTPRLSLSLLPMHLSVLELIIVTLYSLFIFPVSLTFPLLWHNNFIGFPSPPALNSKLSALNSKLFSSFLTFRLPGGTHPSKVF